MPETSVHVTGTQRARSFLGRTALILVLIPLIAASWGLRNAMPPVDLRAKFDGQRPFVYWERESAAKPIETLDPHDASGEPIQMMHVDTGEITSATKRDLLRYAEENSRGERVIVRSNSVTGSPGPSTATRTAFFRNTQTGANRCVTFEWPHDQWEVVNSRYVVYRDRKHIYVVDLEESNPQEFSIPSPLAANAPDPNVKSIYGTDYLYEIHIAAQPNSPDKLELFKLGEHEIQWVKSIQVGSCQGFGITALNGQLLTLSADGKRVEFYSLEDLECVKSIEISPLFLAEHEIVDLQGNLIMATNKATSNYEYYDLISGEQLKLPFSGMLLRRCSSDSRYWCFDDGGRRRDQAYVYDLQERRTCLSIPFDCNEITFLKDGRFAVSHPAYGVCTIVYDLKTGKSIRQAPYQWCAPALTALLLAWFGWWVIWLFTSAREGSWAWGDLALIFACIPGILTYIGVSKLYPQIGLWGSSTNFAILIGAFIGLLCAAGVVFALSPARRSIACLPLTLVYAALNWWLSSIAGRPRMVDKVYYLHVCIVVTASVALVVAASLVMRRFGWRLEKRIPASLTRDSSTQLSVLDMFVFIACSGIVVAVSKPLLDRIPKITVQFLVDQYWLPTALAASVVSFVVLLAMLDKRKWVARFGYTFALVAWFTLVAQQVLNFAGFPVRFVAPTAMLSIVLACTSAFICGLALRLRCCEFVRRES